MTQGAIKKSSKAAATSHKAKRLAGSAGSASIAAAPKRGARVTKPARSAKALKQHANTDKAMRKFSSGLIRKTEALLGERAGHLELIGPGNKANKSRPNGGGGAGGKAGGSQPGSALKAGPKTHGTSMSSKGGSRKFG